MYIYIYIYTHTHTHTHTHIYIGSEEVLLIFSCFFVGFFCFVLFFRDFFKKRITGWK